jgi:hypothetical protein
MALDANEKGKQGQYLEKMHHYWDYLSRNLQELESVKFVNFHSKNRDASLHAKALMWVMLALYHLEDLERAMIEIVSDADFMLLYNMDDSYMWQCKKQIFDCLKELKSRQGKLYYKCRDLDEFITFLNERKIKK